MKSYIFWAVFAGIILLLSVIMPETNFDVQVWSCIILSNMWLIEDQLNYRKK